MDTMEQMLSELLGGGVEALDIPRDLQQLAVERYEEVGSWLAAHGGFRCRIYPQGSFRLGTVVRPHQSGEYDIDLVFLIVVSKEKTTQAELKQQVGDLLHAYLRWKRDGGHVDGPKSCESRRRCWTLTYPDHGFHLDVLPTIPDVEYPPTGILLTDKQLLRWQHSNPIGYATWFRGRSEEMQRRLKAAAFDRHVNVDDVPEWEVRTTLQRAVQVLKWHSMMRFTQDPDNRPPSILVTTLAARAYRGEEDLFVAVRNVLAGMGGYIENRHGKWWVPNPAHEEENFADKWNEYPERREAFLAWHRDLTNTLDDLLRLHGTGLHELATRLEKSFGSEIIRASVQRYGNQRRAARATGALRMTGTGLLTTTQAGTTVRGHTFYGQHRDARR